MPDGYVIKNEDTEAVEMFDGVYRRTMGTTDEAMLCQFQFEANSTVPLHHHMNDQVGYVVSGKVEITVGKTIQIMNAGDSYAIPGGIQHSLKVIEDSILIDVFSPPREDYRTEAR